MQLKSNKDGFTLLPVVSVAGVVGAQLIFDGSTATSLPSATPGPLLRFTQTHNHWSNTETTVDLFKTIIFPHIAARRAQLGNSSAPAIILADAFAAHWAAPVLALLGEQQRVAYISIPDCLTHLFQPLDLGIIAAMKQSIMRRKDEFVEGEVRLAIRENRSILLSKSRPVLRERMTVFIKEVMADPDICAEHCCRSGFERSGVFSVLFGDGDVLPDVDRVVPPAVCKECGESGFVRSDPPPCTCFDLNAQPILCSGCYANHVELCPQT